MLTQYYNATQITLVSTVAIRNKQRIVRQSMRWNEQMTKEQVFTIYIVFHFVHKAGNKLIKIPHTTERNVCVCVVGINLLSLRMMRK